MKLIQEEQTLATAAAKAGMDEKTARKYRDLSNGLKHPDPDLANVHRIMVQDDRRQHSIDNAGRRAVAICKAYADVSTGVRLNNDDRG
jgi:hypothetical protein